jgi:tight adherence protein B
VADKRGFLESVEVNLERANLPLRAAEALFFLGALSFLVGVATFALTGNFLFAIGALAVTLMLPKVALDIRVRRRQKAFVALLPDMLALLAGTLKAGYSITQGFEAVSQEVEEPMGKELRRVVTEHRLGRTLEDALDATADRMGSDDFAWTVMAIKIQREVGGNLAELLLTVANTMTQRERLRRDVNSLTAEGRVSAFILGVLPPGLAAVMFVMNRDYISQLFDDTLGYVFIGLALVAMAIGFAWMKKIITIEV